ncbi:MAG TPA: radical SAM protein, partial [Tepidisphaeraceae bacterium]|nr:radical SAM protein [Tepidisphaeraceae bacterium]
GVRAVGSALADIGCTKTRIVLQQWNKRFRPSEMKLDGRVPDLFMVSTMGMHSDRAQEMIRDARRIDAAHRPLIIAGGSHAVYEPFLLFNADATNAAAGPGAGPDVVVTGEEFVFLSLLEVLLAFRAAGESMRSAFVRARDAGALDDIPGLIYPLGPRVDSDGIAEEIVDTGVQRLLGDLDELPHPVLGYALIEPPGRSRTLGSAALAANKVRWHSPISSLVMTFGCKFACPYCPIPAYNQRQHRCKSPGRIADEMGRLNDAYGLRYFFGTDDNFFNTKQRTLDIVETLATAEFKGVPVRRRARWYTEVTVHDTLQMKDHLPLVRKAGCRALWLGVEDMTATLVNKGQSVNKTTEAFQLMRDNGICPMPMMMHHDTQPLYSKANADGTPSAYGLLNQVRILRKAGAVSLQVLMMTPSPGTKLFAGTFQDRLVLASAGGREVRPYMYDGNYVIASKHDRPWRKQLNLLIAYAWFYNPVWLAANLLRRKTKVGMKPAYMQLVGMFGLTQSVRRTLGWMLRLKFGRIERLETPPQTAVPMRGLSPAAGSELATPPDGQTCSAPATPAAHAPVTVTISARGLASAGAGAGRKLSLPVG